MQLRNSEWVLLAYFAYVAAIVPWFRNRPHVGERPFLLFAVILVALLTAAAGEAYWHRRTFSMTRDWLPLLLTLFAFREMDWFTPATFTSGLERSWIRWDYLLLNDWKLERVISSLGLLVPSYLELCYLLVYGVGAYSIAVLYSSGRRLEVDRWLVVYLSGTLTAYALFPYFPSRPPRTLFPGFEPGPMHSALRSLNLWLLDSTTIHSAVFPSAHVSSVFAAAWGMFLVMPEKKRYGWILLVYGLSVSVATVYGRYHYAIDVAAGFGVSLWAAIVCGLLHASRARSAREPLSSAT